MTRDEAIRTLSLDSSASAHQGERRYQELYSEFQLRLTNAPTAGLKRIYQQRLRELDDARAALLVPSTANDVDLPAPTPVDAADPVGPETSDETELVGSITDGDEARAPNRRRFGWPWRVAAGVIAVWFLLHVTRVARARSVANVGSGPAASDTAAPRDKPRSALTKERPSTKGPAPAISSTNAASKGDPPLDDQRVLLFATGDDGSVTELIRTTLAHERLTVVAAEDADPRTTAGDSRTDLFRADARRRGARLLALVSISTTPSSAANEFGMQSADASVDLRLVDAQSGEIIASRQSHQTGAGTSVASAASNAVRRAAEVAASAVATDIATHRR